jgi:outer membrane protein OmpA-like peptidoglycan-associated protein
MDEKTIQKDFAGALAAQPEKPASYLVFFDPGGVELTPESQAETPQIVSAIRARSHPAVSIIGHTDTTGTDAVNMKISLERAEAVAKLLVERGISRSVMTLQYFGKSDLLIPTADQVAEPKNRRVEVFVR